MQVLKKVPLLRNLATSVLNSISGNIRTERFNSGDMIVEEGTPGNTFYIIKEGSVDITKNGNHIRTIGKNDFFGERSMLSDELRSASIVAKGPVTCWTINGETFKEICNEGVIR